MRTTLFLSFLISAAFTTFAQQSLGVKVSGGASKITVDRDMAEIQSTSKFAPSAQGGFFYDISFGQRSSLGVELLFSQIEGREVIKFVYTNSLGIPTGQTADTYSDFHISYLSLPVFYGFKFNKISANLGVQISYALKGRGRYVADLPDVGYFENESELNIDSYDFGARAGVMWDLTERFGIEAVYYYGINDIIHNDIPLNWDWKIQQVTIGVRYKFWTSKKQ